MSAEQSSLCKLIEEALTLSSKADDNPSAAQALTDILKTLQDYDVRSWLPAAGFQAMQGAQNVMWMLTLRLDKFWDGVVSCHRACRAASQTGARISRTAASAAPWKA